jgi:surfactin synthase thioesterase subunit
MGQSVTLFLLPHAGDGGTCLRSLVAALPAWVKPVPVTLPGRGGRFREPVITEWSTLIDVLAEELRPDAGRPHAMFGHSLGALVALELAHRFRDTGCSDPIWFGASGCIAPSRRKPGENWLTCDDARFIHRLRTLNGTPPELLENPDLMELYLPALRADFHLAASYIAAARTPLQSRLLVLGGDRDDEVVVADGNPGGWEQEIAGANRVSLYPGDHFFINDHATRIARQCGDDLTAALLLDEVRYA